MNIYSCLTLRFVLSYVCSCPTYILSYVFLSYVCPVLRLSCLMFFLSRVCLVRCLFCPMFVLSMFFLSMFVLSDVFPVHICPVRCLSCLMFVLTMFVLSNVCPVLPIWCLSCPLLSCPMFVLSNVCPFRFNPLMTSWTLYSPSAPTISLCSSLISFSSCINPLGKRGCVVHKFWSSFIKPSEAFLLIFVNCI